MFRGKIEENAVTLGPTKHLHTLEPAIANHNNHAVAVDNQRCILAIGHQAVFDRAKVASFMYARVVRVRVQEA